MMEKSGWLRLGQETHLGLISLTVVLPAPVILVSKKKEGVRRIGREGVRGKKLGNEEPRLCTGWGCSAWPPTGPFCCCGKEAIAGHGASLLLSADCALCSPSGAWAAWASVKGVEGDVWAPTPHLSVDVTSHIHSPCLGSTNVSLLFVSLCQAQRNLLASGRSFLLLPSHQQTHTCSPQSFQSSFQKHYLTNITFLYYPIGFFWGRIRMKISVQMQICPEINRKQIWLKSNCSNA